MDPPGVDLSLPCQPVSLEKQHKRPIFIPQVPVIGEKVRKRRPESGHDTDHCGTPAGFHLIECVGGEWNRGGSRDYQRLNAYTALHSVILSCTPPADAVRDNDRWPLHSWRVVNREGSKKTARVGERIVGLLLKRASFLENPPKFGCVMRDLCRICGVRAVGSQCRWIFSSAAKRKLQVILSHVLGWEVTRDGRGEFLCGKCVFQLEKVVQCDVDISQLQDEHAGHIQKLLAEKDHLIQCIVYVYKKNNPGTRRSDGDGVAWKSLARSSVVASLDDEALYQAASEGQQFGESRGGNARGRMKRCVSLDQIASKGSYPSRSGSLKGIGLRGTRLHSQSMYLDLVQRTGLLHRPGFKGRSASLQSLNRDPSAETAPEPQPRLKGREPKAFVGKHGVADDPRGASQARALLRRSPSQPSVISDLIRLLRCISRQQICVPAGSHIPVLKAASAGPQGRRHRRRESELKSLHDLAEEFDDDYAAVRVKVALSGSGDFTKCFQIGVGIRQKMASLFNVADIKTCSSIRCFFF